LPLTNGGNPGRGSTRSGIDTKGSRFIERFLTARQTLRMQSRDLYGFLKDACAAALHGTPTPSLLPAHLRTGLRTAVAA
jgi:hypothetical protein